jgi:hypothetical protein
LKRLLKDGIDYERVIYMQIHDAGSSSPVVLNTVRNLAGLEQRGCHFVDGKDMREINRLTSELGEGAVIYVDDFIGSGDQFLESRNFVKQFIIGNFPEFVIAPCICEEGFAIISREGVEPFADLIHEKAARPLHSQCSHFDACARDRLIEWSRETFVTDYYEGLGYKRLATSVVLYSNAPDTTPLFLRGGQQQKAFFGVLPRFSDLPLEDYQSGE